MAEYATYSQVDYFKKCISAMKHKYKIDNEDVLKRCKATLPLYEMYKSDISRSIKKANKALTGSSSLSVKDYWRQVNHR